MARRPVIVRDVTLRELGQNVPREGLVHFMPDARLWLARELLDCGFAAIEVASCASPKVAPAMHPDHLLPFLHALGHPAETTLVTLVPSARSAERFFDLGLGPDGLRHAMGVFVSAVEAHNLANTRRTIERTLAELAAILPTAQLLRVPVAGYVSGSWGWVPAQGAEPLRVDPEAVLALADRLIELGAASVTLTDMQGLADPAATKAMVARLAGHLADRGVPIGYHPHHVATEAVLRNIEAALVAGATIVDASLGATGGCVTGAPGNAPTEVVAPRLEAMGLDTGLDLAAVSRLAAEAGARIFAPLGMPHRLC